MMLSKIAHEIELLAHADRWLERSLIQEGQWMSDDEKSKHREDVRKAASDSLGARFPNGEIQAEALALALAHELRRLCQTPRMVKLALERAAWPDDFRAEGRRIVSGFDAISS